MIDRIRRSDVLLHSALVFGAIVASNALTYVFYAGIARLASVEVYGEVIALSSIMLLIGAPAAVGQLIVARIAADLDARGDRAALRRLGDVVTSRMFVAGGAVVVVTFVAREPIAHFLHVGDVGAVVATAAATATYLISWAQRGVLQGAHHFGDFAASLFFESILRLSLGVALVVPYAATGALGGTAIALACAVVFNCWRFAARFGRARAPVGIARSTISRMLRGVGIGQMTLTVVMFYDVPLVKHAFDPESAGLYAAAALVGRAVLAAVSFVPTIVMPKANARVASGRSPLPLLFTSLMLAGAIVGAMLLVAALAPQTVITVVAGHAFAGAAPLVFPYLAACGALSLAGVVAAYNFGLHRYDFVLPTCAAACLEIAVLSAWHPTLNATLTVLVTGHALILLATLYRVTSAPALSREPLQTISDRLTEPIL